MSDSNNSAKYKQLALFSVIVAEMTLVPGGLAALAYYLTHGWFWTGIAAAAGFTVAFYRIYLMTQQHKGDGK